MTYTPYATAREEAIALIRLTASSLLRDYLHPKGRSDIGEDLLPIQQNHLAVIGELFEIAIELEANA